MTTTLAEQLEPTITAHDAADELLREQLDASEADNAKLREQLDHPPILLTPPRRILVGACPPNGQNGRSLAAIGAVQTKLGVGATVRAFASHADKLLLRPKGPARIHWSLADLTLAEAKDHAKLAAMLADALPGDEVEGIHELDHKVNAGSITLAAGSAIKSALFDTVVELVAEGDIADVTVVNTVTGWAADPKSTITKGDLSRYMAIRAHRLGADFDGIDPGVTKAAGYPDFYDEVGSVAEALARSAGYSRGWKVPELAYPRATWDPDGVIRAARLEQDVLALERTGCTSAEFYDYQMKRDNRLLPGSPELAVALKLVARGVAGLAA